MLDAGDVTATALGRGTKMKNTVQKERPKKTDNYCEVSRAIREYVNSDVGRHQKNVLTLKGEV